MMKVLELLMIKAKLIKDHPRRLQAQKGQIMMKAMELLMIKAKLKKIILMVFKHTQAIS